jgi:hypothetical protein
MDFCFSQYFGMVIQLREVLGVTDLLQMEGVSG